MKRVDNFSQSSILINKNDSAIEEVGLVID